MLLISILIFIKLYWSVKYFTIEVGEKRLSLVWFFVFKREERKKHKKLRRPIEDEKDGTGGLMDDT